MRQVLIGSVLLGAVVAAGSAQKLTIPPGQHHLFIVADKADRLQEELNQAAASGLHVIVGQAQGVYLRRDESQGPPGPYRVVIDNDAQDFEKALNAAGEQGYRVVPATVTRAESNNVAILRRRIDNSPPYRYRMLPSDDGLGKSLEELATKGFRPIGVLTQQSRMAVSMGRAGRMHVVLEAEGRADAASASGSPLPKWRAISTLRTSTLEEELNEAGAEGYRVRGGSVMNVLVEQADPSARFSYRVIATRAANTAVMEIQQAGRDGFRVLPSAIMDNPRVKSETVVLMERSTADVRYEYVHSMLKSHAYVDDLVTKGFSPAAVVYQVFQEDYFMLFERPL